MGSVTNLMKIRSKTIQTGKFLSVKLTTLKKYSEDNKIPLFIFWGSGDGCGRCCTIASMLNSTTFKNWMAKTQYLFGAYQESDIARGTDLFHFIRDGQIQYPFVKLYWQSKKVSTTMAGYEVIGGTTQSPSYNGLGLSVKERVPIIEQNIQKYFSSYTSQTRTLIYNLNGGTGTTLSNQTSNSSNSYKVTLSECTGQKSGYDFSGWKIDSNIYQPGTSIVLQQLSTYTSATWTESIKIEEDPIAVDESSSINVVQQSSDIYSQYSSIASTQQQKTIRNTGKQITVKGQTKIASSGEFPYRYGYTTSGNKDIRFSNNLSDICIVGDSHVLSSTSFAPGFKSQLISAYINSNITRIAASCFYDCSVLTSVNIDNNITYIDDYAFYNCERLTSIGFASEDNRVLEYVGNYSFARSGLKTISLNVQRSVSDTGIGTHSFASCLNLTDVELTESPYLGEHMFDGCSRLTSIIMSNYHSYVHPYCFANCTSLTSITFPKNMYMLADYMFKGCTSLKKVTFEEPSQLKQIGEHVFDGCTNLTSITLPASINSLSTLNGQFLAGSSIDRIVFNGLTNEDLGTITETKKTEFSYQFDKIYSDYTSVKNILSIAMENNIPVMVGWGLPFCSLCKALWGYEVEISGTYPYKKKTKDVYHPITPTLWKSGGYFNGRKDFKQLMSGRGIFYVWGYEDGISVKGGWMCTEDHLHGIENLIKKYGFSEMYRCGLIWKKSDGTFQKWNWITNTNNQSYTKIKSILGDYQYEGSSTGEIKIEIDQNINTMGRGTGISVEYVSLSGTSFICTNDEISKSTTYRVDKNTTDDFKYGIWYYNAKELKEFADENNIPVFVERSSRGCDPCIDFLNNTWKNSEFQSQIKQRKCLLCRVEADGPNGFNVKDTQEYFVSHNWGVPTTYIPECLTYWKKSDGTVLSNDWNYNYRTDPANANYEYVLTQIDNMLEDYTPDDSLVPPDVFSVDDGSYHYYDNQEDDENGRYFICDHRTRVVSADATITIEKMEYSMGALTDEEQDQSQDSSSDDSDDSDDSSNDDGDEFEYTIENPYVGQEVELQKNTYQYFTDSSGDLSGYIFKVDDAYFYDGVSLYWSDSRNGYVKSTGDDGTTVYQKDSSGVTSKRQIMYMFRFQNDEEASEILEEQSLYDTGTIYSFGTDTPETSLAEFFENAGSGTAKFTVIFELDSSSDSQDMKTNLIENQDFVNYMRTKDFYFAKVESSQWTANAPKKLIDIQQYVSFDGNTVNSNRPKIHLWTSCYSCVDTSQVIYGEVWCAKTLVYDSSKNVKYWTDMMDAAASTIN